MKAPDEHPEHGAEWVSSRPRAERARQIADVVRAQITGGDPTTPWRAGERLPDERELARRLGASRNACRDALALLCAEGLITRRRGVGTTVIAPKLDHGLNQLAGLAEVLVDHGTVTNEVRSARVTDDVPPTAAERLGLADGEPAVAIERLRRLDDEPLSLDTTFLTWDVGRPLLDCDLAGRDVFALLEETTGQRLGHADVTVHAITADPDTAALLGLRVGAALFAIERLTHLADGRPIDTETIRLRADRVSLRATVHRGTPPPH